MYNTHPNNKNTSSYKKSDIDILKHINNHTLKTEGDERDSVTLEKQCILYSSTNRKLAENNNINHILKSISKD